MKGERRKEKEGIITFRPP